MEKLAEIMAVREDELHDALRLLELQPDFARLQVLMRDRLEKAGANATGKAALPPCRPIEFFLQLLNIRAECYLPMVCDISTQNAYIVVLLNWGRLAWQEYTGFPLEVLQPVSEAFHQDLQSINTRVNACIKAGYQRLANFQQEKTASLSDSASKQPGKAGIDKAVDAIARERRALVDAYIEEVLRETGRKITRRDIWTRAGYETRTEFQRWQRNDLTHVNEEANRRFVQVFTRKPHLKKT